MRWSLEQPMLRIGVIGTGFGRYGHLPAFRQDSRCEVVALAARSPGKAAAFARQLGVPAAYDDWQQLLDEARPDAIAIATPPAAQVEIVRRALHLGMAVFAEKPLALNPEQAAELAQLAQAKGLPNMVGFLFPELKTWRQAEQLLEQGAIGAPRHIAVDWRLETHAIRTQAHSWKTNSSQGGGMLQHYGCHVLYYLERLFGPLGELTGALSAFAGSEHSCETLASLHLVFCSGLSGTVSLCSAATLITTHRLEIYGSDGALLLENNGADPVAGFTLKMATRAAPQPATLALETTEDVASEDPRVAPLARLATRFLDWRLDGAPAKPSFQEGLRVQQLMAAVQTAAASGRTVRVAPAPDRNSDN